ncbi:MAG TPA: universal stress protein [Burkholderiaceae bacterium]|jgi:nucleotide-binding universal stress UspA family protein
MYKKILIPVDGSPLSEATALAAVEFAQQIAADAIGLFVAPDYQYSIYDELLPHRYATPEGHALSMQKSGEAYLGMIKRAAEKAGVNYFGVTKTSDSTAQTIVDTAREYQCDLIFMGSHGRSGLGKLLLGSVTSRVLALCDIPVFVYRLQNEDNEKIKSLHVLGNHSHK